MADVVAEAPFCAVCRISSVKWRKHVFSRSHQQKAQQLLLSQAARLQELSDAPASWWRCVFCGSKGDSELALTHFSSEQHKKRVEEFCVRHRCDADRQIRPQLWLRPARRRELESCALRRREAEQEQEEPVKTEDGVAGGRTEEFLTSAAKRLQEVQAERKAVPMREVMTREQQQTELLGPQVTGVRRCKTVTSGEGVLQNPLGRHGGARVWGGGVVKLRKAEWIPWAIDQLVKEEMAEETPQRGAETAFAHRVTEFGRGEGLNSIQSVSWRSSVGNVHTSAVPPWMVQTEEEYKKCNRREQVPASGSKAIQPNGKGDKKRRDIFSELQSKSDYGPDWLPNFGGVWQEGPRSKTKQAFRKAAPSRLTDAKLSRQWRLPVNVQLPQPPSPPQSLPPQQPAGELLSPVERSENAVLPSSESRDDESKPTNPLDAKKQLLLAQKERLRAKMVARRRQ